MKSIYLLFISLSLSASSINMDYVGELSIFGKVAVASIVYSNDGKKYHIKVVGHGTGIVGYLTQNKKYIYESIGIVKNKQLVPMKYIAHETRVDLNKTKVYVFDYEHNKTIITKHVEEKRAEPIYNVFSSEGKINSKFINEKSTEILDKVYNNDMVSVLFNKKINLLNMKIGEPKLVHAAGSKDTQEGIIVHLVSIVDGKYRYSVILKKDYLESGSAKVTFILDSDNILYEAKVDGILFFGNATVKRYQTCRLKE